MSRGRLESGDVHAAEPSSGLHLDFGFLTAQAGNDRELVRDLLQLFLDQARRLVPHLLTGSCQGCGAFAAADAMQGYEDAGPDERLAVYPLVVAAFAEAETSILGYLATI